MNCGSSAFRPSEELYVLTQGSNGLGNNVASFGIDLESGNLTYINSNATTCPILATPTNTNPCGLPVDILLDPTGNVAFVLDQGAPACPLLYACHQLSLCARDLPVYGDLVWEPVSARPGGKLDLH